MKQTGEKELDQMIREMPDEKKLDFLRKVLEKNEALRNQFTMFYEEMKQKSPPAVRTDSEKIATDACTRLRNELESLDFENMDWKEYVPRHSGYIEDYEAWEDFAEGHLSGIFEGLKELIRQQLYQGDLFPAICESIGLYDACLVVEIPGSENIFEDLTTVLLGHHQELMNDINDILAETVGSGAQISASIDAIFVHFMKKHSGEPVFLKYMEPTLLLLTESEDIARHIYKQFEKNRIDESLVPQLAVKLASFSGDVLIWREKAEEYMESDLEVARQLMDYYWAEDPTCFRLVGQKLFREYPGELCNYFSELLYPMFDEGFYKEVLRFRTLRDRNIDIYKELRNYLSEDEKLKFFNDIFFDDVFKVRVLTTEKRYPEILTLVQKEAIHTYYFPEMITPILNIYPAEVLDLIGIKCEDILRNHKKRSAYKHIAEWLKLSKQIKGMEEKSANLIHEFYNRKPALPALKEEMREAGVIGGKD